MKDLYHAFLKRLAHFQIEHPYLVFLFLIALTVAIFGGVSQVRTVASLEQMMPKDIEEIKAFHTLRDNHLGQDIIAVIIEIDRDSTDVNGIIDIRDKQVYTYLEHLKTLLQSEPDIIETYAYSDIINIVSPQGFSEKQYYELVQNPAVVERLEQYINDDKTITILMARTDVSADDERMTLLSSAVKDLVDRAGHPPGIKISFTGTPIIQQRLGELISHDRQNTAWISTVLVFIITMIIFGTFSSALVPIIIVTLSVNWLYGTMGYTGLPISTLAGGVAAMVIGIGIDFAIHIMNKFKYERKKGMNIAHSIECAVVETGTALTASSMTTIAAFLAFLFGTMPEMGRFGLLMAIGITYALIFSLFGLPALLIIEEKLIYWLKRKMRFGLEGEFSLEKKGGRNA